MNLIECMLKALLLIRRIVNHVFVHGSLSLEEKNMVLQAVLDLTRAVILNNSVDNSTCQGYNINT